MGAENRRHEADRDPDGAPRARNCDGCGSTSGNKVGATVPTTRTLTFEVPDDSDPPAEVFSNKVAQGTHGQDSRATRS